MPRIGRKFPSLAFVLVLTLASPTVFGAGDDLDTEAPNGEKNGTNFVPRAFTLDPEDGTEIMLAMPSYEKCVSRMNNALSIDKSIFWSSNADPAQATVDPDTNETFNKTYSWVEARNECRKKCMDLVTLDDPIKTEFLMTLLTSGGITSGVWTAGKRCLFDECADVPEPVHLNGWYWTTTGARLHPADTTEPGWPENPWADFGVTGGPQPDNAEMAQGGSAIEACLAIKTAPQTRKPGWHDVACNRKLGAVCEPSLDLLKFVEDTHGVSLNRYVADEELL